MNDFGKQTGLAQLTRPACLNAENKNNKNIWPKWHLTSEIENSQSWQTKNPEKKASIKQ